MSKIILLKLVRTVLGTLGLLWCKQHILDRLYLPLVDVLPYDEPEPLNHLLIEYLGELNRFPGHIELSWDSRGELRADICHTYHDYENGSFENEWEFIGSSYFA